MLYGIGQGAIAPVIPLSARELGASVATASLVVAMIGIGRVVGDLPAGQVAMRWGERRAMLAAVSALIVALGVCIVAHNVVVLAAAIGCIGIAAAVFGLARHTYLAEVMPYELRGRALSVLGGTKRIGLLVGPFLGAVAMMWLGTDGGYWVFLAMAVIALVVLVVVPDPPMARVGPAEHERAEERESVLRTIRRQLPVLRTLGFAILVVTVTRSARRVAIPLWGDHIGLEPATVSLIFGLAGAIDVLMAYPAGMAMDRLGRRWVAVPSTLIMAVALALVPLTEGIAAFTAVAMLTGLGHGLGSGMIMTVGADASPPDNRAAFLGAWRLCVDVGDGAGPLVVSAIAAVTTLGFAAVSAGALGAVAALLLACWIPPRRDRDP